MQPSVSFTVPLTAAILRAMLSDLEGTAASAECCGGKSCTDTPATTITANGLTGVTAATDPDCGVAEPLTSGIVEHDNPFVAMPALTPQPITEPFILTPEGIVPVTDVTDPFLLQVAAPPVLPLPMPPVITPPLAPPTGVKVDGEGLPWDQRIHVSTKTFRQSDNTWKLRKGVDATLVEAVKAELRACMAVPVPASPLTTALNTIATLDLAPAGVPHLSGSWTPETGHVVGIPVPPVPVVTPPVPAPPVTVAPEPPPVVTPPPAPGAMSFTDFVTWATGKMVAKEISRTQLEEACKSEGISSMPMLQNRPDLIPAIHKFLESICLPASSVGGV